MATLPSTVDLAKPEIEDLIQRLASELRSGLVGSCDKFGDFEAAALDITSEVTRVVLEAELQALSDQYTEEDRVEVDGKQYKAHRPGAVDVPSLVGQLHVTRFTFRQCGVRNGPTIVPMALVAGLVEGATPVLAKNVAHGYADRDMREHLRALELAHRRPPARATLERLATRCGQVACEAPSRIEKAIRRTEKLPDAAYGISFGIDRTTAPMAEPRKPGDSIEPRKKRKKDYIRAVPEPIDVNYRMAYVATVSIVDKDAESLVVWKYAVPACDEPGPNLIEGAIDDIRWALRKNPGLKVGVVQDGAPEMWNLARAGLEQLKTEGLLEEWVEAIDRWHVVEHLSVAAGLIEPDVERRKVMLAEWQKHLATQDSAIDTIQHRLQKARRGLARSHHKDLDEQLTYIENNKDRMRYVSLSVEGLPIGSGATEGAAKNLVGQRGRKSGQRWGQSGLRGVLKLRCLSKSGRLLPFWTQVSKRYVANVTHVEAA